MGLCGSKGVSSGAVNRALRRKDAESDAWVMERLADIHPEVQDSTGVSPFAQACKCGSLHMAEAFLNGPFGGDLLRVHFSEALWHCCKGDTDCAVASMLLKAPRCADPNWYDRSTMNTPMHCLAKKRRGLSGKQMAEKCQVVALLCQAGAKFDHQNGIGLGALDVGMDTEFERASIAMVKGGADLKQVQTYLKDHPYNAKNWCANSLLSKFAFKHPIFLKQMKAQFMKEFDPDGSGELDKKELLHFIAFHVKVGFQQGMAPVTEFNGTDLDLPTIELLLKERCPELVSKYESLDKDGDGTYTWSELLPISEDFYKKLWSKGRPEGAGKDEYGTPGQEADIEAKCTPLIKAQVLVKPDPAGGVSSGGRGSGGKNSKYAVPVAHTVMAKPKGQEDQALPDGWKEVKDLKSGKTYYYHKETKKTSWKRPREESKEEERC
jgi:hypothetical protein